MKKYFSATALALLASLVSAAPSAAAAAFQPNPLEKYLPPARSKEESLWRAFTYCNLPEAKQLLASGVRADKPIAPREGPALLGLISGCFDTDLIDTLTGQHTDFNSFSRDSDPITLLRLMVAKPDRNGKLASDIKTFIQAGADPSFRGDNGGLSPVDLAAAQNRTEVLKVFLAAPAFKPQSVTALGMTPIHSLVTGMCTRPAQAEQALAMLIAAGVPVKAKNKKGQTAADLVAQFARFPMGSKGPICGTLKGKL